MPPAHRTQTVLLAAYKRLPPAVRTLLIRLGTPSFHVGAICVVERPDGHMLLVRQSYRRDGWGFPGGLMRRGEEPAEAARRELHEELGVDVELEGLPVVVIDSPMRRVDVVFHARLAASSPNPEATTHSPEISAVRWFPPDGLPDLLPEATAALIQLGRTFPPR
ncbi:MAG TPA: NUDIX domain-containing protein [Acidimicrobiales bacterium]|nr:NUDIX domain-containing protein [Acidimicrobiales bacterium]